MYNVRDCDLDGRPSLILRSEVYLRIQRCPLCGYCAPDITRGLQDDHAVLESEPYRMQLGDTSYPQTANTFLCHGLIMEKRGQYADTAWSALFAAWICDDNGFPDSAQICRRRAIEFFMRAKESHQSFARSDGLERLYMIDILRRLSEFGEAARMCESAIAKERDEELLTLLEFEIDLIEERDTTGHAVSEILEGF